MQTRATEKLTCHYFNSFQLGERWQTSYTRNSKSNEFILFSKNVVLGKMQRTGPGSAGERSMLTELPAAQQGRMMAGHSRI